MSQLKNMDEVLAEELKIIQDRRVYLKFGQLPDKPPTIAPDDARRRASEMGLTGLAFSGGGIRSATFALGVLQGLARLNLLSRFDYLSTVSGGGYIGAWLAAWVKREGSLANVERQLKPKRSEQAKAKRDQLGEERKFVPFSNKDQPFAPPYYTSGKIVDQEPEPIHHIRSYSNYLAPKPGLASADTWALLAIYLRNFAINAMTILPATAMLVIAVRLIVNYFTLTATAQGSEDTSRTFWISVIGAVGMVFASVISILKGLREVTKSRDNTGSEYRSKLGPRVGVVLPLFLAAICFTWVISIGWTKIFDAITSINCYLKISRLISLLTGSNQKTHPTVVAFELAGATGVLVGFLPLLFNLKSIMQIRRAEGEAKQWSRWNRAVSALRIALVPFLAGFNGGMFFYLIALGSVKLVGNHPCAIATFGPPLFIVAVVVAAISYVWLLGPCLKEDEREWWASVTGLLIQYAIAWLSLFSILLYGVPGVIYLLDNSQLLAGAFSAVWLAISQGGAMNSLRERSGISTGSGVKGLARKILIAIAPPIFLVGLLLIVSAIVGLLVNPLPHQVGGMRPEAQYLQAIQTTESRPLWFCLGGSSTALVIALCLVDVNMFSLNAMYANRLVRCYLGASRKKEAWKNFKDGKGSSSVKGGAPTGVDSLKERTRSENSVTGFDLNDDIPLYDLHFARKEKENEPRKVDYEGPFPLINTALNLVAGEELALQDRKADSFVLSPLYCGSRSTGYRELPNPKADPDPTLSLGLAAAISGAAVDPNMGSVNSLPQTMLMTVFNARLGRWLPNPAQVQAQEEASLLTRLRAKILGWLSKSAAQRNESWRAAGPSPGKLLFDEFFGWTRDDSKYVHLSDGGHFENLGVYELVRRRCRFIVACDAGQDGGFLFEDLAGLIRKCRTDFGVRIEIDVTPIKPDPAKRESRWHCAVGSIHYEDVDPKDAPGILVYIKASITGDETPDVQNYATVNPAFPHESTADQFFDESQFESYRALGFHIASEVFFSAQEDSGRPSKPLWDSDADVDELRNYLKDLKNAAFQFNFFTPRNNQYIEFNNFCKSLCYISNNNLKSIDDLMSSTLLESCSVMEDFLSKNQSQIPTFSPANHDPFRKIAEWYWNWENRTLFSDVRRRWFPPPPDMELHYKGAIESFSKLHATLRSDPKLRHLSLELYPELEAESGWRPSTGIDRDSQKIAELHAVNEILMAMEQAWLGVKLEGYPEHPLNRGYLNVFRRCAASPTLNRHWPTVRGSFNQEFVLFCERELKLASTSPSVESYNANRLSSLDLRSIQLMQADFAREWPKERPQLDQYLDPPWQAWLIRNGRTKGENGAETNAQVVGVIALNMSKQNDAELFVWIRSPYRNIGIGRQCLAKVYSEWPPTLDLRTIRVRYPDVNPTSLSDQSRRNLWMSFFQHYDFTENEIASAQEQDLILERPCHQEGKDA